MKNKILLTGSLGFIASNLIRKAAYEKSDYIFAGVDKALFPQQLNNIYNSKIISNHYLADITDAHTMSNIFSIEQPDIVIHGASFDLTSHDYASVKRCFDTNVIGTQILVNNCFHSNKPVKFIYLSTDKVYDFTLISDTYKSLEIDHPRPETLSAISHLAAEKIITKSTLDYNILRLSDIYGPRQGVQNFIPDAISKILIDETRTPEQMQMSINIEGDGSQTSSWTHVFDVSSAILTILNSNLNKEIINVSSGQECSLIELAQFVCNSMKSGHDLIYCSPRNDHKGVRYSSDNSKLLKLGWKPNFKLRQGIQETCDWYKLNQYYLK